MNYIIKIETEGEEPQTARLHYFRKVAVEDLGGVITILDAALNKKPRKARSDKGEKKPV